jgi:hypothetical protein
MNVHLGILQQVSNDIGVPSSTRQMKQTFIESIATVDQTARFVKFLDCGNVTILEPYTVQDLGCVCVEHCLGGFDESAFG